MGDPLNAVRIFNEKEVDELMVLDIDATAQQREPDYKLIKILATECRMPLCYGGGVSSEVQVQRLVSLGVEKVAMGTAAALNPEVIGLAAERVGSQSIVVVMDIRKKGLLSRYHLFISNGSQKVDIDPAAFASQAESYGAGELVINNIDRDGAMSGYDLDLIQRIREVTRLPITTLGGAGSLEDIAALISRFGIIGAAAGSLFVFKGTYRAVLINYPDRLTKDALIFGALN